ncbi:MAG: formylglycine-generating enzyme family protein [Pirellulales bacterium]|nr:formylglycine-generating enzyme family protein [Pirellulales bacterium]
MAMRVNIAKIDRVLYLVERGIGLVFMAAFASSQISRSATNDRRPTISRIDCFCAVQSAWLLVVLAAGTAWADDAPAALTDTLAAPSAAAAGIVADRPASGRSVAIDGHYMTHYTEQIPGTSISFEMIPIRGGDFLLGSPADEKGRRADEGPQVRVRVGASWIGKCEVTWHEYQAFMESYYAFKSLDSFRAELARTGRLSGKAEPLKSLQLFLREESLEVDGVTCPTPLYDPDTTYSAGDEPNQPAVTMTQFAAKQYTKWLSGITGRQYRLPTEAEWEYAARAGTATAYSFGHGHALDDYAWHAGNAGGQTHAVASKRANPWGIHDMHGNAAEWVLDEYDQRHYAQIAGAEDGSDIRAQGRIVLASDAVRLPTRLYPRVIRGGCWFDEPARCRSAARHQSEDPEWNMSDPNLPKSPWWFTEEEATGVGFRIVRPWERIRPAQQESVWAADVERIRQDVADRLSEGRGTRCAADVRLPAAIGELEAAGLID